MRRYTNAIVALAIVATACLAFAAGYRFGRQHVAQVDLVWTPLPDAVAVGWSVADGAAIAVYRDGQLVRALTPDDGAEFQKWEALIAEAQQ